VQIAPAAFTAIYSIAWVLYTCRLLLEVAHWKWVIYSLIERGRNGASDHRQHEDVELLEGRVIRR
jgi:hypothetical protein